MFNKLKSGQDPQTQQLNISDPAIRRMLLAAGQKEDQLDHYRNSYYLSDQDAKGLKGDLKLYFAGKYERGDHVGEIDVQKLNKPEGINLGGAPENGVPWNWDKLHIVDPAQRKDHAVIDQVLTLGEQQIKDPAYRTGGFKELEARLNAATSDTAMSILGGAGDKLNRLKQELDAIKKSGDYTNADALKIKFSGLLKEDDKLRALIEGREAGGMNLISKSISERVKKNDGKIDDYKDLDSLDDHFDSSGNNYNQINEILNFANKQLNIINNQQISRAVENAEAIVKKAEENNVSNKELISNIKAGISLLKSKSRGEETAYPGDIDGDFLSKLSSMMMLLEKEASGALDTGR